MILEMGFIVFIGLLFLFMKLPKRLALQLLGRPLLLDVAVSVLVYILHAGTFSGMMAAAVAGMMASIFTTIGRRVWGYIDNTGYHPGFLTVDIGDTHHAGAQNRK